VGDDISFTITSNDSTFRQTYTSTTTVDEDGIWNIEVSGTLSHGDYTYTATSTDIAGNTSTVADVNITIDTESTVLPWSLSVASDTGILDDAITSEQRPVFEGSNEVGAVVKLSIDGTSYSATVDENGSWSIKVESPLDDGVYNYDIRVTDVAGNQSTDSAIITIDTLMPSIDSFTGGLATDNDSGQSSSDNITNVSAPTFEGLGEINSTVELSFADGASFTTEVDQTGNWQIVAPIDLEDGQYDYTLSNADAAGNTITLPVAQITIDTVSRLTVTGLSADTNSFHLDRPDGEGDHITNVTSPKIEGEAEAGARITFTLSDSNNNEVLSTIVVADQGGRWEVAITDLAEDVYHYSVESEDIAGNITQVTDQRLTIDTTAPAFSGGLQALSDSGQSDSDGITDGATPTFEATGEANASVLLSFANGQSYTEVVDEAGKWQIIVSSALGDGKYTYTLSSTDVAANTITLPTAQLTIDTESTLTVAGLSTATNSFDPDRPEGERDHITNVTSPTIEGEAEPDARITLRLRDGNNIIVLTTSVDADSQGLWAVELTNLANDAYHYTITAEDVAGNTTLVTNQLLTIDTNAPTLSGALAASSDTGPDKADGITNELSPVFEGQGDAAELVTLDIQGRSITTTVDGQGFWRITIPADDPLSPGEHSYVISSFDIAGNQNKLNKEITLIPSIETPVTVSLVTADDKGTFNNDNITNITVPKFTGTGGGGDTILFTLTNNNVPAFSQPYPPPVTDGGSWSIQVNTGLEDGDYSYSAVSTDIAGNTSATPLVTLTIETQAPALSGGLKSTSDTGTEGDNITKEQLPVFEGNSDAGAVIELRVYNSTHDKIYSVNADQDGKWSIPVEDTLVADNYAYTITASDLAGNQSTENGSLTVDTLAPGFTGGLKALTDSGRSDTDDVTFITTPVFSGLGEVDATVLVTFSNNQSYSGTVNGNGRWEIIWPSALDAGEYVYTLSSTDAAGNTTTLAAVPLSIDTVSSLTVTGLTAPSNSYYLGNTEGASDHITNVTSPSIEGVAEPDASITLTLTNSSNIAEEYMTAANAQGVWVVAMSALAQDEYRYTVKSVDIAGNETLVSNQLLTIDATAPVLSGSLDQDSDFGRDKTDGVTNELSPVFSGTGEVGAAITLNIQDRQYTATVSVFGTWEITIPADRPLSPGEYTYIIRSFDLAGNQADLSKQITLIPEIVHSVTVRLAEGDDTGTLDTDNITNLNRPNFTGTGGVGDDIVFTLSSNNTGFIYTSDTRVPDSGTWSIDLSADLDDGVYTYSAVSTDIAGNTSDSAGVNITIDTKGPALAASLASDTGDQGDDRTQVKQPVFEGISDVGAVITLNINNNPYSVIVGEDGTEDGTWSITVGESLADGPYNYTLSATDVAGNKTNADGTLTIDNSKPTFTGGLTTGSDSNVNNDGITNVATPTFGGTGEINAKVLLEFSSGIKHETVVDQQGNWQIIVPNALEDGDYEYTLSSTDAAANTTTLAAAQLTIDTLSSLTVSGLSEGTNTYHLAAPGGIGKNDTITSNTNPIIEGQAEPDDLITLTLTGTNGNNTYPSTNADSNGKWSQVLANLSDGTYHYTVKSEDIAGNIIISSKEELIIDNTAPGFSGGLNTDAVKDSGPDNPDGITKQQTPTFSGSGEVGAFISLVINGERYTVKVDGNANWQITLPDNAPLPRGDHAYTISSFDIAGNTSALQEGTIIVIPSYNTSGTVNVLDDASNIDNDGFITTTRPTFSGQAANFDVITVSITDDRDEIRSQSITVANENGLWTLTWDKDLGEGKYSYSAISVDRAGNASNATTPVDITIDTTAPNLDTQGLATNSDTAGVDEFGNILGRDKLTYDTTPTFSGFSDIGQVVILEISSDDNNDNTPDYFAQYEATVGVTGSWNITVPSDQALTEGVYQYVISATDEAGNAATPQSGEFTIDDTPPLIAEGSLGGLDKSSDSGALNDDSTHNNDGVTNDNTPLFSGTGVEAGAIITLKINEQSYYATVLNDMSWSIQLPDSEGQELEDGTYAYTLSASDAAGNISNLPITQATGSITVDTENTLADSGHVLQVYFGNFANTEDSTAYNYVDTALVGNGSNGRASIWRTVGSDSQNVGRDFATNSDILKVAGDDFLISSNEGPLTNNYVRGQDNISVTFNYIDADTNVAEETIDSLGISAVGVLFHRFYVPGLDVTGDQTTLTFTFTDLAGNTSSFDEIVELDTSTRPLSGSTVTWDDSGVNNDDGITSSPNFSLDTGTALEEGLSIRYFIDNLDAVLPEGAVNSIGAFFRTNDQGVGDLDIFNKHPGLLPNGNYQIRFNVRNEAGLEAELDAIPFTLDCHTAVTIELAEDSDSGQVGQEGDNVTAVQTPTLSGTLELGLPNNMVDGYGMTLELKDIDGTTFNFDLNVDGAGGWTALVTDTLSDGQYTATANVTDIAGNTDTQEYKFVVDTAKPTAAPTIFVVTDDDSTNDLLTNVTTPTFTGFAE
jgi:hypothetical protein